RARRYRAARSRGSSVWHRSRTARVSCAHWRWRGAPRWGRLPALASAARGYVLASSPISARFRYALKIASWPKLLVPVAFGQVLGALAAGRFDGFAALYAFAFAVFDLAFIVL